MVELIGGQLFLFVFLTGLIAVHLLWLKVLGWETSWRVVLSWAGAVAGALVIYAILTDRPFTWLYLGFTILLCVLASVNLTRYWKRPARLDRKISTVVKVAAIPFCALSLTVNGLLVSSRRENDYYILPFVMVGGVIAFLISIVLVNVDGDEVASVSAEELARAHKDATDKSSDLESAMDRLQTAHELINSKAADFQTAREQIRRHREALAHTEREISGLRDELAAERKQFEQAEADWLSQLSDARLALVRAEQRRVAEMRAAEDRAQAALHHADLQRRRDLKRADIELGHAHALSQGRFQERWKQVLHQIALLCGANGQTPVSLRELADAAGLRERVLYYYLTRMKEAGLIDIILPVDAGYLWTEEIRLSTDGIRRARDIERESSMGKYSFGDNANVSIYEQEVRQEVGQLIGNAQFASNIDKRAVEDALALLLLELERVKSEVNSDDAAQIEQSRVALTRGGQDQSAMTKSLDRLRDILVSIGGVGKPAISIVKMVLETINPT